MSASGSALPPVAELYARHGGAVRRRIRRFFDGPDVDEILQEVFVLVIRDGHQYRAEAPVLNWLYRLTTRHCLIQRRNRARRRELLDLHGSPPWGRPIGAPEQEPRVFLDQLWLLLGEDLAEIGIYYFVDGLSQADIGELLGVSGRTISSRLAELRRAAQAASEAS